MPRIRHQRYDQYDRLRHGRRFKAWIAAQATRLTVVAAGVHNALVGTSVERVQGLANIDLPIITVAPVVSGTATVGQTLTVTAGTVTGVPTPVVSRQWINSVTGPIKDATGLTYVLKTSDIGATVRCLTTARNAGGSVTSLSNATATVA